MKLKLIDTNGDYRLYKRVATNGSSAWAFVGAPPYVIYKNLASYREFDWESEARAFFNSVTGQGEPTTAWDAIKQKFSA